MKARLTMAEEDTDWSYSSTVPTLSKCYLPGVPNHILDILYLVSHKRWTYFVEQCRRGIFIIKVLNYILVNVNFKLMCWYFHCKLLRPWADAEIRCNKIVPKSESNRINLSIRLNWVVPKRASIVQPNFVFMHLHDYGWHSVILLARWIFQYLWFMLHDF